MLKKRRRTLDLEKRLVFLINFVLIVLVIVSLMENYSLRYFFYFNIFLTLFISYIFFRRSKKVAKALIVTNLFIFFYFLFPIVAWFLNQLFGINSYIFIILYNILIAYIFLVLSGYSKDFLGNFKKFSWPFFCIVLLFGLVFGLLFNIIREPVPGIFVNFGDRTFIEMMGFLIFSSFVVAVSEQMIFSGFLFNTYRHLSTRYDAYYQVAVVFVLFHILRLNILVDHYKLNFGEVFFIYLGSYYALLFAFMTLALYFYSFKHKGKEGNFMYPVALHFAADFGLFFFYIIGAT